MRKSKSMRAAVALAAAGLLASAADAATIYNLGDLGGGQSFGNAINASGQVTGTSNIAGGTAGSSRAFIYSGIPGSGGAMHNLGTLGDNSFGNAINASGQVVGTSRTSDLRPRAFLYSGGTMQSLGTLGGLESFGAGINAAGQITGSSEIAVNSNNDHAFLYTPGGSMISLGTLGGGASSGFAINDAGQVVGSSFVAGGTQHAFRYTPGTGMQDLGILAGALSSTANAINARGQVAGWSGSNFNQAFLYTGTPGAGGTMLGLGTLGGTNSFGSGINGHGHVVGRSFTSFNLAVHAFLYTGLPGLNGQMFDLDVWLDESNPVEGAKWTLSEARGINDSGLITGNGVYNDGPGGLTDGTRAFLLDASDLFPESTILDRTPIVLNQTRGTPEPPFPKEKMRNLEVEAGSPIGVVQQVEGFVVVTRTNGDQLVAQPGTPIYMNDVIETNENGAANVVFVDHSTFGVAQNARLDVDEYVYDPDAESPEQNFISLRDVFVWTSEQIGSEPEDPNVANRGNLGIRGDATPYLNWDPLNPAAEMRSSTPSVAAAAGKSSFSGDVLAAATESVSLYTSVEVPDAPFELAFDYAFLDPTGVLDVAIDGVSLLTLTAGMVDVNGVYRYTLDVTDPAILELLRAELAFTYEGDVGSSMFIDNVSMPGLNNGDFGEWDNGWFSRGAGQVDLVASVVPEPAALSLLSLLAFTGRRARSSRGPKRNGRKLAR